MTRNARATVGAILLTLALVVPASAATATVTETFTVASTLTVTNIPATLDYGTIDAGTTSAAQSFSAKVTANTPWGLMISATAFTSGANTIPAGARQLQLSSAGNTADIQVTPYAWVAYGTAQYGDATADATGSAGTDEDVTVEARIAVPNAAPGTYSGSMTLTFTAS